MTKHRAINSAEGRTETATVRLSPRLRFFAELAAIAQGISLSNYVETLLEADWPNAHIPRDLWEDADTPETLGDIADDLWAEGEQERFANQLQHPWTLRPEQLRLRDLIYSTPALKEQQLVTKHWDALTQLVTNKQTSDPELLLLLAGVDWQFIVMGDKERTVLYRADPEQFTKRSQAHLAARNRIMYPK